MLTFAEYQHYQDHFAVDRDFVSQSMEACQSFVIEALGVHVQRHLWRGELPVYPVLTTPQQNGGWGHLMPFWFKPQERPIPLYVLDNWALFALIYANSFGPSAEARQLVKQVFSRKNLVQVVVGTNLQLPFLPSTQGRGRFFRHGMLPYLLAMLWLEADTRQAWLRLHELGGQSFIDSHGLAATEDPIIILTELEYAIFNRLERNTINSDEAVKTFLDPAKEALPSLEGASLLSLYQDLFGAICLGVTALTAYYRLKPLEAWRDWIQSELIMPYRMSDYGIEAIKSLMANQPDV